MSESDNLKQSEVEESENMKKVARLNMRADEVKAEKKK